MSDALRNRSPFHAVLALTLLFVLGSALPSFRFFSDPTSYLALHMALEFVAMAVAAMVCALGWNLRDQPHNTRPAVLGAAFLAVLLIDFAHTLSYQGMPQFVTPSSPEKAINFWLAARYAAALAFLAILFTRRNLSQPVLQGFYFGAVGLAALVFYIGLFHADSLPRTFVEGQGLTPFKIGAEYLLVAMYWLAAIALTQLARREANRDLNWLAAAAWTFGLAELFFTFYADVTDVFNLLGHVYKVAGCLMIYAGLFVSGVRGPQLALLEERSRLQLLEQRWKFAIEGSAQGVWDWDAVSNKVFFSPQWKQMLGYAEHEVSDNLSEWETRVHAEDLAHTYESLNRHIEGLTPFYESRHRMRAKNGSWRWILDRGMVVERDAAGKPTRIVGTHTDIHERVEAVAALAASEQRYRSVLNSLAEGLVIRNEHGVLIACNPAAEKILGVPAGELMARSGADSELTMIREDGSLFPHDEFPSRRALVSGQPQRDVVMGVLQPKGKLIWISVNAEPMQREGEAAPVGVAVTLVDITQRRYDEEMIRQSESRYRAIVDTAPVGVMMITTSGHLVQANAALGKSFGYETGVLLQRSLHELIAPESAATAADTVAALWEGRQPTAEIELCCQRRDESRFWASLQLTTLCNDSGRPIAVLGILEDIELRHEARLAIEASNRVLQEALGYSIRHEREILLVNRLHQCMHADVTEAELYPCIGEILGELFVDAPGGVVLRVSTGAYDTVLQWGGGGGLSQHFSPHQGRLLHQGAQCTVKEPDGSCDCPYSTVEGVSGCRCIPLSSGGQMLGLLYLHDSQKKYKKIVGVVGEALKLMFANLRLRDELANQASHDGLTGLYNRRSLDGMLPRELALAERSGEPLVVAMLDADHFKRFNDTWGHAAGDQLLIELARVLEQRLRKSDFAARYGGEEFVVVLSHTSLEGALELLREMADAIAAIRVGEASVTVSIGVVTSGGSGCAADSLLLAADKALYAAKAQGRNRIVVASDEVDTGTD